nr:flowering locus k likey domain [Quercus suber]
MVLPGHQKEQFFANLRQQINYQSGFKLEEPKMKFGIKKYSLYLVMVSAKEELNLSHSPAMDALLRVHKRIIDVDTNSAHATSGAVGTIITRVADTQAGSLIGKWGSTIKSIQDASNCTIRVLNNSYQSLC